MGWIVWQKGYFNTEWLTILPEYWRQTKELAESVAQRSRRQLSIVDVMVLPPGQIPSGRARAVDHRGVVKTARSIRNSEEFTNDADICFAAMEERNGRDKN